MRVPQRLTLGFVLTLAVAETATAGIVVDNSPIRTTMPNGFVVYDNFSAADDFVLSVAAAVTGGRLWTWEEVGIPTPLTLNYAFWSDADASSLLPTQPAAAPRPGATGIATVQQRISAGANQLIGGVEYAPYEYLIALDQAVGLPADTPLWLSFNIPDATTGPVARYLWAYTDNPGDTVNAWGTANVGATSVDWAVRASSGTAFTLVDDELRLPEEVPLPAPLMLMLPVLSLIAARRMLYCQSGGASSAIVPGVVGRG